MRHFFYFKLSNKYEIKRISYLLGRLFSLKLVRIGLATFIILIFTPTILFVFMRPKPQKEINYGVTFSKKYTEQLGLDWRNTYIQILDDLKVKNIRLVAYWDDIEREPGNYNFNDIVWQVEEAERRNVDVIMTLGRKVLRYPECFEPEWWKNTPDETTRNEKLYSYIKTSVLKLKKYESIKMWQVENEPFFPFGSCMEIKRDTVRNEIQIVRSLDSRPILIQDSGEGGFWYPSYIMGDYLGISMYRKIWYNFWGIFFGRFIYFQYPLAHWTYKIKADLLQVPYEKIIVTELQSEPWGPAINSELSEQEKDKTMSETSFIDTINYAQKAGFKNLYFWGVEWWYWEKEKNGNPYYWNTAKAIINR